MPIEANSSLTIQLLLIQFLSRIYDGDKLGKMFWAYVTFTSLVVLRMKPEQWLYIYICSAFINPNMILTVAIQTLLLTCSVAVNDCH